MSDNIFGHIFQARQAAFGIDAEQELEELKQNVQDEINGRKTCTAPRFLMFKITNQCNSNCIYCGYARRNKYHSSDTPRADRNTIQLYEIDHILDEARDLNVLAVAYNGGEPLLHKDITEIIAATHSHGIAPILMTNGLLLPHKWKELGQAGLKYVMISLDSMNEDVFSLQRGVPLSSVMEGVEVALRMRDTFGDMVIHLTAVVTKHNISELCTLADFAKKHDIWLEICSYHHILPEEDVLSVSDEQQVHNEMEKLISYKQQGFPVSTSYEYMQHLYDFFIHKKYKPKHYQCMVGYTMLQIDGYLDVRPCWDDSFGVLGNLRDRSVKELWTSQEMEHYRRKMISGSCLGCWNMCNEINSLLNEDLYGLQT